MSSGRVAPLVGGRSGGGSGSSTRRAWSGSSSGRSLRLGKNGPALQCFDERVDHSSLPYLRLLLSRLAALEHLEEEGLRRRETGGLGEDIVVIFSVVGVVGRAGVGTGRLLFRHGLERGEGE